MNILEHISSLLYRNDCVIIPEFGAFIAQEIPSVLKEGSLELFPPSKKLSFNASLTNNDGLLVNELIKKENLLYNQATLEIEALVAKWARILKNERKLELKNIGHFEFSREEKLIFFPDIKINYLSSSFGLEPIKIKELASKNSKNTWKYAAALFFVFFLGLRNLDKNEKNSIDSLSSIFASLTNTIPSEKFSQSKYLNPSIDLDQKIELSNKKVVNSDINTDINREIKKKENKQVQFDIILGVFDFPQKAKKLLHKVKKKFALAANSSYEKNRTYVIGGSYPSYEEAKKAKKTMQRINKKAWIKKVEL